MATDLEITPTETIETRHTEECVLYAVLTGQSRCMPDCQELREAFPVHPALRYSDEALRRAAEEREAPFALDPLASTPTLHTSRCVLAAIRQKRPLCIPECAELRHLDPTHPLLRYSDANLAQAAAYGANEPTLVARECPACHHTITLKVTLDRGQRCPRCGIGIPIDLLSATDRPPGAIAQVLGWDTVEAGYSGGRW